MYKKTKRLEFTTVYNLEPKTCHIVAGESSQDEDTAFDLASGEVIAGQFEVIQKLGAGGTGSVYSCIDLFVERTVAVKVLFPDQTMNPKSLSRFRREAKAIAKLNHPNIVRLHSFNFDLSVPYIVMENVEGVTLANYLQGHGAMDIDQVVKLSEQLCSALQYAHENGVIHRDLKPSNIIIERIWPGHVQAKLLDFGIAKVIDDTTPGATTAGELFGTPSYMSPEQALGKAVDRRTDQYSLGCVLFECLTGSPPFVGSGQLSVLMQHVQSPIPSLDETTFNTRFFPPQLQAVIDKMLAKFPEDRYDSMTAVFEHLCDDADEDYVVAFSDLIDEAKNQNPRSSRTELRALQSMTVPTKKELKSLRQANNPKNSRTDLSQTESRSSNIKLPNAGPRSSQTNMKNANARSSQTNMQNANARSSQTNMQNANPRSSQTDMQNANPRSSQTNLQNANPRNSRTDLQKSSPRESRTDSASSAAALGARISYSNLAPVQTNVRTTFSNIRITQQNSSISQLDASPIPWILWSIGGASLVLLGGTVLVMYLGMNAQISAPKMKVATDQISQESMLGSIDVSKAFKTGIENQLRQDRQRRALCVEDKAVTDRELAALRTSHSIEDLDLSYCEKITNDGMFHIFHLPLTNLNLRGTSITDSAVEGVAEHFPKLITINLFQCGVTDDGIKYLPRLSNLVGVDLRFTEIRKCCATFSKIPHLRYLLLDHTNLDISDLNVPELRRLGISGVPLSASALNAVLKHKKLELLSVNRSKITDDQLLKLSALRTLKEVDIQDCENITAKGIGKFKAALPGCKIRNVDESEIMRQKVLDSWTK